MATTPSAGLWPVGYFLGALVSQSRFSTLVILLPRSRPRMLRLRPRVLSGLSRLRVQGRRNCLSSFTVGLCRQVSLDCSLGAPWRSAVSPSCAHGTASLPDPICLSGSSCSEAFSRGRWAARVGRLGPPSRAQKEKCSCVHWHDFSRLHFMNQHFKIYVFLNVMLLLIFLTISEKEKGFRPSRGNP